MKRVRSLVSRVLRVWHDRKKRVRDLVARTLCAWFGHSNVETRCFGYHNCARCGAQVGDTLAGAYENDRAVIVGHDCETCFTNWKRLRWIDRVMVPYPFTSDHPLTQDERQTRHDKIRRQFDDAIVKMKEARDVTG